MDNFLVIMTSFVLGVLLAIGKIKFPVELISQTLLPSVTLTLLLSVTLTLPPSVTLIWRPVPRTLE